MRIGLRVLGILVGLVAGVTGLAYAALSTDQEVFGSGMWTLIGGGAAMGTLLYLSDDTWDVRDHHGGPVGTMLWAGPVVVLLLTCLAGFGMYGLVLMVDPSGDPSWFGVVPVALLYLLGGYCAALVVRLAGVVPLAMLVRHPGAAEGPGGDRGGALRPAPAPRSSRWARCC